MIDNREQVDALVAQMRASLPLSAALSRELQGLIRRESPGTEILTRYRITRVDYAGDEGGIMCALECRQEQAGQAYFVSLTHLCFAPTDAMAHEIAAYQKRRIKRLRRLNGTRHLQA
jgi:hypothetical protein